jgi:hypothetical protein
MRRACPRCLSDVDFVADHGAELPECPRCGPIASWLVVTPGGRIVAMASTSSVAIGFELERATPRTDRTYGPTH